MPMTGGPEPLRLFGAAARIARTANRWASETGGGGSRLHS